VGNPLPRHPQGPIPQSSSAPPLHEFGLDMGTGKGRAEIDKLREEMASASGGEKPKLDSVAIIQREFPGSQLSQWSHQDAQGQVYGFPETIEVDVIKHNNMSYLCSIRESVDIADVVFLIRIGRLYKSINPQSSLACVIISRDISARAKSIADRCKMKCIIQA